MKEKYKKRLCELAGAELKYSVYCKLRNPTNDCGASYCEGESCEMSKKRYHEIEITLETLIKAMWAINRKKKWIISIEDNSVYVCYRCKITNSIKSDRFWFEYYNNSEQAALEAALIFILDNEEKQNETNKI